MNKNAADSVGLKTIVSGPNLIRRYIIIGERRFSNARRRVVVGQWSGVV